MRFLLLLPLLLAGITQLNAQNPTPVAPPPADWAERGEQIWTFIRGGQPLAQTGNQGQPVRTVGWVDFTTQQSSAPVEIDVQMVPDFRNRQGELVRTDLRNLQDPVHGTQVMQSGGQFLKLPVPYDHDEAGNALGLKVNMPANPNAAFYNRIGIRFGNSPPGRLLFLYEMSSEGKEGTRWYAHELNFPLTGCPWRPLRAAMEEPKRESHLRKLAVFQIDPWQDPADRIPAKLRREDLAIDFDAAAAGLTWPQLQAWMVENISDDRMAPGKTFVIQLPPGRLEESDRFGMVLNKWTPLGKTLNALTEGRKVWLIGHPDTTLPALATHDIHNVGVLFTRIGRREEDGVTGDLAERYDALVSLHGKNLDFRNNWLECPDGVSGSSITLVHVEDATITDNILGGGAAGFSTGGNSKVVRTVIARNWMERAYDAVQMYGGWSEVVLAYNHFAGASGFANRQARNGHMGANLHTDEFQSQANLTPLHPQQFWMFSNLAQFGRHNWPPQWAPIGGATQNIIIDSDAYVNTHIYWNIFQNLQPTGHRGIKTISPDKDWVLSQPDANPRDYIENMTIVGNAFLERWDHNHHPLYGYWRPESSIGGRLNQPFFELINTENLYATTHLDRQPAQFKNSMESRPDPEVRVDWRKDIPTLTDVYQRPLTFTGSVRTGYHADFSRTAYAGHKLLEGFLAPGDFRTQPDWERSPGGAARLTPAAELEKIAPMPTDLADFLGDASRRGGFFDELSGPAVPAKKREIPAPWREAAPDDGFLLHVKFGSVGTPGTRRELLRESGDGLLYRVLLTEADTARFELWRGDELLSRVESTDTFEDGDHLSLQVYTPYFPVYPEGHYPLSLLKLLHTDGIRRIRYLSSPAAPPPPAAEAGVLQVWMNPRDRHHFSEWRENAWREVKGGFDAVHACAIRAFSPDRNKFFSGSADAPDIGTLENFRRDLYPVPEGKWMDLYLDGPGEDSSAVWQEGDLRWVNNGFTFPGVFLKQGERVLGGNAFFTSMGPASGRPRCVIRHNLDHQDKKADWIWTPDVDLPRGAVTLFDGFDGSYESFRVIRGGQGEYGLPKNHPAYRYLESITAAMAFLRPPLNDRGQVPGWGTPELYLKAE